eukprot:5005914-Alexandrium_andersonii.AAC.1
MASPLARRKTSMGPVVVWIGARLALEGLEAAITVLEGNVEEVRSALGRVLQLGTVARRGLRSLAGELSIFVGFVPRLEA